MINNLAKRIKVTIWMLNIIFLCASWLKISILRGSKIIKTKAAKIDAAKIDSAL